MSVQRDIDAELRFHFDTRIEELMRQGKSRDEARAQAHVDSEFGHGLRCVCTHCATQQVRILTICYEFCAEALDRATHIPANLAGTSRKWRK